MAHPSLPVCLSLLAAMLCPSVARSHDWYPAWCCSDKDCRALIEDNGETVTEEADGWRLWDGRLLAPGTERLSPDRHFHICEEVTTKAVICFFAPPGGS